MLAGSLPLTLKVSLSFSWVGLYWSVETMESESTQKWSVTSVTSLHCDCTVTVTSLHSVSVGSRPDYWVPSLSLKTMVIFSAPNIPLIWSHPHRPLTSATKGNDGCFLGAWWLLLQLSNGNPSPFVFITRWKKQSLATCLGEARERAGVSSNENKILFQ